MREKERERDIDVLVSLFRPMNFVCTIYRERERRRETSNTYITIITTNN
jgi:hypothetical protein